MNRFWIILIAVVLVLGGLFFLTKPKTNNSAKFTGDAKQLQSFDHVRNGSDKKVTLIEYGDFQCPSCGAFYPIIKQLEPQFSDQVSFAFRDFPLISLHPNAFAAARAAEAAGLQNKFFEMHDKLYENQNSWASLSGTQAQIVFESYADGLGLDMNKFKQDFASQQVADIINRDIDSGNQFKVNATPTFILNGQKIEKNPESFDDFAKLLNDAIKKAGGQEVKVSEPTGSTGQ